MDFVNIKPVNVVHGWTMQIRTLEQRIIQRAKKSNVNVFTNGVPQTGKTNDTVNIAYSVAKKLGREFVYICEFEDFRKIISSDNLRNIVLVYDEINSSWDNWFDVIFQLVSKVFDRFGFRGLICFIIAPKYKSIYSLIYYCQFTIFTEIEYDSDTGMESYKSYYSYIKINRYDKKIMEIEFGYSYPKPCNKEIWDYCSKIKEISYKKFLKDKVNIDNQKSIDNEVNKERLNSLREILSNSSGDVYKSALIEYNKLLGRGGGGMGGNAV